jgi:tetratricopeptide (TPR) repeat protein
VASLFFGTCFLLFAFTSAARDLPAGSLPFFVLAVVCYAVATVCLSMRQSVMTLPIVLGILGAALWLADPYAGVRFLAGLALLVAGPSLVAGGLYVYLRWRDRVWFRAIKLTRAGDVKGALHLLQEQLQRQGPSATIYHQLAMLQCLGQNWEAALRMVEEAERLGNPHANVQGTKGLALWKLGRTREALACLETAANAQPNDLISTCNYGSVLAELGRAAEASEMLQRAERLFETQTVFGGAAGRQMRRQALEELRRKVSESLGRA